MPFVETSPGSLEWYDPPYWNKTAKRKCNTQRLVMAALRKVMRQGEEYSLDELILGMNESAAGQKLNPPFRGKNAQTLMQRLVRNGKIDRVGVHFYALPEAAPETRGE